MSYSLSSFHFMCYNFLFRYLQDLLNVDNQVIFYFTTLWCCWIPRMSWNSPGFSLSISSSLSFMENFQKYWLWVSFSFLYMFSHLVMHLLIGIYLLPSYKWLKSISVLMISFPSSIPMFAINWWMSPLRHCLNVSKLNISKMKFLFLSLTKQLIPLGYKPPSHLVIVKTMLQAIRQTCIQMLTLL